MPGCEASDKEETGNPSFCTHVLHGKGDLHQQPKLETLNPPGNDSPQTSAPVVFPVPEELANVGQHVRTSNHDGSESSKRLYEGGVHHRVDFLWPRCSRDPDPRRTQGDGQEESDRAWLHAADHQRCRRHDEQDPQGEALGVEGVRGGAQDQLSRGALPWGTATLSPQVGVPQRDRGPRDQFRPSPRENLPSGLPAGRAVLPVGAERGQDQADRLAARTVGDLGSLGGAPGAWRPADEGHRREARECASGGPEHRPRPVCSKGDCVCVKEQERQLVIQGSGSAQVDLMKEMMATMKQMAGEISALKESRDSSTGELKHRRQE